VKPTIQVESIFSLTKKILDNHEREILNNKNQKIISKITFQNNFLSKIFYLWNKYFMYPFQYLMLGLKDFFNHFNNWLMFISPLLLAYITLQDAEITKNNFLYIILMFSMFLLFFSVPTTFALYGLNHDKIMLLTDDLKHLGINDKKTIEYIESTLDKIYLRVMARYMAYRWIIGSIWIFSITLIAIYIKLVPQDKNIESLETFSIYILILLGFTLFSIFILTLYKRASDIIFKSIEFSLIELKYQLDQKKVKYIKRKRLRFRPNFFHTQGTYP